MTIIWCMVPEIRSTTDRSYCHFGLFFALLLPYGPRKSKFWKHENNVWRYHFTHVYQKWQSYDVWLLRYAVWWTKFFVILDCFLPFYPLNNPKNQNFAKMKKKHLEVLSFYTCVNDNHIMNGSWEMEHDRQIFLSFWTISCHLPS